jgi:hypothetical protein
MLWLRRISACDRPVARTPVVDPSAKSLHVKMMTNSSPKEFRFTCSKVASLIERFLLMSMQDFAWEEDELTSNIVWSSDMHVDCYRSLLSLRSKAFLLYREFFYRAIGFVLDFIHRLVCGRQDKTMDKVQNKPNSSVQHKPSSESFQVYQSFFNFVDLFRALRFTATGAPPTARRPRIFPMN